MKILALAAIIILTSYQTQAADHYDCDILVNGAKTQTLTMPIPTGALFYPLTVTSKLGAERHFSFGLNTAGNKMSVSLNDGDKVVEHGTSASHPILGSFSVDISTQPTNFIFNIGNENSEDPALALDCNLK